MEFDKTVPFDNGKSGNGSGGYVPATFLNYGHTLKGRYRIESVLGEGGFGITYACRDTTLDMKVAVKEYFPQGFVSRDTNYSPTITYTASASGRGFIEKGREQFLQEAKILAKFSGEKGVVNVRDFFEENNTAYIVMEFLDGQDLKQILKQRGTLPAPEAVRMLMPVMESLEKIHRQGLIHRDISPDNIRMAGNTVKLLDFGAARSVAFGENKSMTVVLKHGYAPIEQYSSSGVQGPWTDVYALCATLYLCITGQRPVDAPGRTPDDVLKSPSQLGVAIDPNIEKVLMKGLGFSRQMRHLTVKELMDDFNRVLNGGIIVENRPAPTAPTQPIQPISEQPTQYLGTATQAVQPAPKPKKKSGVIVALAGVAIAVVIAVVGVAGFLAGRENVSGADSSPEQTEERADENLTASTQAGATVGQDDITTTPTTHVAGESATADGTTVQGETTATNTTTASNNSGRPSTTAEIVSYYNNAINKVNSSKAGYTKTRTATTGAMDGGAILKLDLVVEMINDLLGVGTKEYTNPKGSTNYLKSASLASGDVTSATCSQTGSVYTITLNLKGGQSQHSGSDTSPLKKSGLYVGQGHNSNYDYRNASNIYSGILDESDSSVEAVKGTVSNTKIVATIDAATGRMKSLTVSWSWSVQIINMKYSVVSQEKLNAAGSTTVKVTNFQW